MNDKPKVYFADDGAVYERTVFGNSAEKVMSPELVAFIRALIQEEIAKALQEKTSDKPDKQP